MSAASVTFSISEENIDEMQLWCADNGQGPCDALRSEQLPPGVLPLKNKNYQYLSVAFIEQYKYYVSAK